jgi:hypothetical protein
MYIDLLRNAVSGRVIEDRPILSFSHWSDIFKPRRFDPTTRERGRDWPSQAHTMIGTLRLNNLQQCIESVLSDSVPGDLIETGVWRGGATIFMRGVLKAYGVTDRTVWVADSFAGLPPPDSKQYRADRWSGAHLIKVLAVSEDEVRSNFTKYDLLDERVRFLKGWFRDSLPTAPIDKLAIVRLDGDMYESTMDGLTNLYPKLSSGGYVIVDDYVLPACAKAVSDYRLAHQITEPIVDIDGVGAYWRRSHA